MSPWCRAPNGMKEAMVAVDPEGFFAPTSSASGVFGDRIGVYLDTSSELAVHRHEIATIIQDAYCVQSSTSLVAELDKRSP